MPAPQASMMKQLARTKFISFGIVVPTDFKANAGVSPSAHYSKAFKQSELAVVPGVPPQALFLAATPNKYQVDTQKKLTQQYGDFIDGVTAAICSAWGTWQSTAVLTGVIVNAVTAAGGTVVGPPLTPLILAEAPNTTPMLLKYSAAVANAVGTGWLTYQSTIMVAGMPWYPAFAAVPSPVAPPSPNIPCPVAALTQVSASISTNALKGQMIGNLGDPTAPFHKELFESISFAFEQCYNVWQASTMVTNVLGTGPVPVFAPPYVPVGPVVGGVANMTPGGFV